MSALGLPKTILGILIPGLGHAMLGRTLIGFFCSVVFLSAVFVPFFGSPQSILLQSAAQPLDLLSLVALVLAWSLWPFFILGTSAERAGVALFNLPVVFAAVLALPILAWVEALIVAAVAGGRFLSLRKAYNNAPKRDAAKPRGWA